MGHNQRALWHLPNPACLRPVLAPVTVASAPPATICELGSYCSACRQAGGAGSRTLVHWARHRHVAKPDTGAPGTSGSSTDFDAGVCACWLRSCAHRAPVPALPSHLFVKLSRAKVVVDDERLQTCVRHGLRGGGGGGGGLGGYEMAQQGIWQEGSVAMPNLPAYWLHGAQLNAAAAAGCSHHASSQNVLKQTLFLSLVASLRVQLNTTA